MSTLRLKANAATTADIELIIDNCSNAPEAINVTQILLLAISTSEIIMTAQGHRFIGLLRQRINELVNNIVKNS